MPHAIRWNGQWRVAGGGSLPPDPQPEPPNSWTDMIAAVDALPAGSSQRIAMVDAWYGANTGHEALGLSASDLTTGSLTSTTSGQTITGIRGGNARWAHSNVTYRGCRIEWSSALYGAYGNPTFGNPLSGIKFEYCTFVGQAEADTARRAAVISANQANAVTFKNCNFSGGTSGIANDSAAGGAVIEYCWVHDLAASNSSNNAHRTSMRATAGGGRFYRNYCTDGGSSCISVYFDKNPISNFEVRENILNGSSPNASPSYLITMKEGEHVATASNVKIVDNYLGPEFQFGLLNGVANFQGLRGNEISGNRHLLSNNPI